MGNKKGSRTLNILFNKDKDNSIFLVGMYGQLLKAREEEKIQQKWGYSTVIVELRNNERFELPLNNLNWKN